MYLFAFFNFSVGFSFEGKGAGVCSGVGGGEGSAEGDDDGSGFAGVLPLRLGLVYHFLLPVVLPRLRLGLYSLE